MIETVRAVLKAGMTGPVCLVVHGIFDGSAHEDLIAAGCRRVVTCNTVPHPTNALDVADLLVEGVRDLLAEHFDNAVRGQTAKSNAIGEGRG